MNTLRVVKRLTLILACLLLAACGATVQAPTMVPAPPPATKAPPTDAPVTAATAVSPAQTAAPVAGVSTAQPSAAPTSEPQASNGSGAQTAMPNSPALARTLSLQQTPLQGDDVRALQQRLLDLGYAGLGTADGIFGAKTDAAVRVFQAINGLKVDGIVGPKTYAQLTNPNAARFALNPIVDVQANWLLGASSGARWIDAATAAPLLPDSQNYQIFPTLGKPSQATATKPMSDKEPPCPDLYTVKLQPEPSKSGVIGLAAGWNPQPHPVTEVKPDMYHDSVAQVLRENGVANPNVRITRALQADMDGDGKQEVVLSATYRATQEPGPIPSATSGDYSLVLLLHDASNQKPTLVASDIYSKSVEFAAPLEFHIPGIFDLNGDGTMEIVLSSAYYEGASTGVYALRDGKVEVVLETGCGV